MDTEKFRGAVVALVNPLGPGGLESLATRYSEEYFGGAAVDAAVQSELPAGLSDESLAHLPSVGEYAVIVPRSPGA